MTAPVHVQTILDRLDGVRRNGSGWAAKCPTHADREQSLGVVVLNVESGRVNLRCHAGCDSDDVRKALDLAIADLYPDRTRSGVRVLREHRYHDENGVAVYAVRRLDRGRARFVYVHPTDDGWKSGRGDAAPVLYRLPSLLANPDLPVFVTEGERDADSLAECVTLTTTVASGRWDGIDVTCLAGREVFIVADNDRTGWRRAQETADVAIAAGAVYVEVFRPPDEFKDVTAMLARGRACGDLIDSVDLRRDEPPAESWEPIVPQERSAFRSDGTAIYVTTPIGVLLHFVQAEVIDADAVLTWLLLEDRAGDSSIAFLTDSEIARLLKMRRHRATTAVDALIEAGLVRRDRRGRVRVMNPARRGRGGDISNALTYCNHHDPTHPLQDPTTSTPASGRPASTRPRESDHSTSGEWSPDDHWTSGTDADEGPL